ncbi:serine/threonine-protein kinase [Leptolyngbya subtilissima DQ-A4]|uniref:non-specific serine/threonine protein kinase n=1 Tax=Leptolyngbya subtilissima DQ-A4 TaxID=2933933 RepID=A0ABV0JY93_9CYAN
MAKDLRRPGQPRCVVKQLRPRRKFSAETWQVARRLFDQEAEILERLGRHDQIPLLLAHLEENGKLYIVQDFIAGRTLRDELHAAKRLPEQDVTTLLRQGLEVLSYVHQQGVIHRDIKPENLIRRQDGVLCLIDFGIVKEFSAQQLGQMAHPPSKLIATTVSIGTEGYTPLEQARGKPYPASDVYALGMVVIEALTGRYPNDLDLDPNTLDVVWRKGVKVSDSLAEVLTKMVCGHYSRRYANGAEALQSLQVALGEAGSQADVTLKKDSETKPKKGLRGVWQSFKEGFQDASEEFQAAYEEELLRCEQEAIAPQEQKAQPEKNVTPQKNPEPKPQNGLRRAWENFRDGFQDGYEEEYQDDLSSEKGVDYTHLRDLLKAGKWRNADQETYEAMIRTVGKKTDNWFTTDELLNFPCTDLRTIDRLWVKYSQGKFGFSVQKQIYIECGAKLDGKYPGDKIWDEFCNRIGWRKDDKPLVYYDDLKANPSLSPTGEFPAHVTGCGFVGGLFLSVGGGWFGVLFSRTKTCEL